MTSNSLSSILPCPLVVVSRRTPIAWLAAGAVRADPGRQRADLVGELADLFLEEGAHGEPGLERSLVVDDGQEALTTAAHELDRILRLRLRGHGDGWRRHDLSNRGGRGVLSGLDDALQDVILGERTEQAGALDEAD